MKVTAELWGHQAAARDALNERLDTLGGGWLIADCGTGKTLTILSLIEKLKPGVTIVFTTLAAAVQAWPGDVAKRTEGLYLFVLSEGTIKQRYELLEALLQNYKEGQYLIVINYEAARNMTDLIARYKGIINLAVCDESHKLKAYDSMTSNGLAEACIGVKHKIIMTGTPWEDKPTDVYGQMRWLTPTLHRQGYHGSRLLGRWTQFFETYVDYLMLPGGLKKPVSYKNIGQLKQLIDPYIYRVRAEDVLTLPEEVDIHREVVLPAKLMKAYNTFKKKYVTEYEGKTITADMAITLALRLHQITCGHHPELGRLDDTKAKTLLDILDEIGGYPVVVFTTFTDDVDYLYTLLTEKGYDVKRLVGGIHEHVEFNNGAGNVLIANLSAGAEGVTLTRARYCVYYSKSYSRSTYVQSRARVRRPGADLNHPVVYYHISAKGTMDKVIQAALDAKEQDAISMYEGIVSYVSK